MDPPPVGTGVDPRRWVPPGGSRSWDEAAVVEVDRREAATVLRLRPSPPPELLPGQYLLVRVAVPGSDLPVEQAYSVCSSPFPPSPWLDIAVRAVDGGRASPVLAREVEPGDRLQIRGPYGQLTWTEDDGGPVVLVGAGTGVAPMAAIVRYAAARGSEIPMTLLCSSRDRATALLREELEAIGRQHGWLTVVHTFTRAPGDALAAHHRRVDAPMLRDVRAGGGGADRAATRYYVAGPGDFVAAVRTMLVELGVDDRVVVTEDHA